VTNDRDKPATRPSRRGRADCASFSHARGSRFHPVRAGANNLRDSFRQGAAPTRIVPEKILAGIGAGTRTATHFGPRSKNSDGTIDPWRFFLRMLAEPCWMGAPLSDTAWTDTTLAVARAAVIFSDQLGRHFPCIGRGRKKPSRLLGPRKSNAPTPRHSWWMDAPFRCCGEVTTLTGQGSLRMIWFRMSMAVHLTGIPQVELSPTCGFGFQSFSDRKLPFHRRCHTT